MIRALVNRHAWLFASTLAGATAIAGMLSSASGLPGTAEVLPPLSDADPGGWGAFGRTASGTRFSPLEQITPANVAGLKVAWTYRNGEDPLKPLHPFNRPSYEVTPIKAGNLLYLCTPRAQAIAVDARTGKEVWRYDPHTNVNEAFVLACRGVTYYDSGQAGGICAKRIVWGTMDGRIVAVDALTGLPCEEFGRHGEIALTADIGSIKPGTYGLTSPPIITKGVIISSAFVLDSQGVDSPSGVVRGYDAKTGRQLWAWDSGRDDANAALKPGETYRRGSPNAWSIYSADEDLGMVYFGTGNNNPDYFGATRSRAAERNSSSVVALDSRTGALRWRFQTVHHDLFDYDVASQPVLTRMGGVPVLIQPTKSGQLFVLDRRTGKPVSRVVERAVSTAEVPGERVSHTQPFSVDMPSFVAPRLTEASLWGISPFDLLACQIKFRQSRYDGEFTAPTVEGSIHVPSNMGSFNWSSVAVDEARGILIANTSHVAAVVRLIPRKQADALEKAGQRQWTPQAGTPYSAEQRPYLSPLGYPCTPPPWGLLTAIDLKTKRVLWREPLGTTRDKAPVPIGLKLGMPNMGGSAVTRSGLTFIGSALENRFRAFDTRTGRELWSADTPAGPQASPMTYLADGRQYVVIAAGGHSHMGSKLGDYLVAYALPKETK
jgi:quinoprotein glucose dehydrogenase